MITIISMNLNQWPGRLGLIPGQVISKTQKMVLNTFLLNTQHYKVYINSKVDQSKESSYTYPTPQCCSY